MKMKNMLIGGMSLALVACISVGATLAYMSSTTKVATNTFVMEKSGITLTLQEDADPVGEGKLYRQQEVNYNEKGEMIEENWGTAKIDDATAGINYKDLLPGDTVSKKPELLLNVNHVPCYVYVTVENGSEDQTIQNFNAANWIDITDTLTDLGYEAPNRNTKIYRYKVSEETNVVPTATTNLSYVFTGVQLDGDAISSALAPIKIQAYAVQAGGDMSQDKADGMAAVGLSFTAPSTQS